MRKTLSVAVGVSVLLLGAGVVSAQEGNVCRLIGDANISPGLHRDPVNPINANYEFGGQLINCVPSDVPNTAAAGSACSKGTLTGAWCGNNQHQGNYVICPAGCTRGDRCIPRPNQPCLPVPGPSCGTGNTVQNPVASGHLAGVCAGANCSGHDDGDPDASGNVYSIVFDADTLTTSGEKCDPEQNPAGLTNAGFQGVLGFGR